MRSVIYMGTPDFAVPGLKALLEDPGYDVKLVLSQPDKPQGRHQTLVASPVKLLALQFGVEVFQPVSLRSDEVYDKLSSLSPDFIVVAAYGKILPQRVLDLPRFGCVNLHGSLLPRYRGAAPIQWCVINGERKTGVTSMLMDAGVDTGDILLTSETEIGENETAGELFDRLAALCPALLLRTLDALAEGKLEPVKQDEAQATYVSVLSKEDAVLDWTLDAAVIHNRVRGLNPWPVAKTGFHNKLLKIYSGLPTDRRRPEKPGTLFSENGRLFAVCGGGSVYEITSLQLEGAKRMTASDFLRGHDVSGVVAGA